MNSQPRNRTAMPPQSRRSGAIPLAAILAEPPGTAALRSYLAGDVQPGLYPPQLAGADLVLLGPPPQHSAFV